LVPLNSGYKGLSVIESSIHSIRVREDIGAEVLVMKRKGLGDQIFDSSTFESSGKHKITKCKN
jgi:hypothetical protein